MISNQHLQLSERSALFELCTILPQIRTLAVRGVNLLILFHRSIYWVLLVHSALFCIIQHNPSCQSHLTMGFLHQPAGERAPIHPSTTSAR